MPCAGGRCSCCPPLSDPMGAATRVETFVATRVETWSAGPSGAGGALRRNDAPRGYLCGFRVGVGPAIGDRQLAGSGPRLDKEGPAGFPTGPVGTSRGPNGQGLPTFPCYTVTATASSRASSRTSLTSLAFRGSGLSSVRPR